MADPFSIEGNSDSLGSQQLSDRNGEEQLPTPLNGIEVSSRVSLSRNIASYPFFDACSQLQRQEVQAELLKCAWVHKKREKYRVVDCQRLQLLERQFLFDLQAIVGVPMMDETCDPWPNLSEQQTRAESSDRFPSETTNDTVSEHKTVEPETQQNGTQPDFMPAAVPVEPAEPIRLVFNHEDHLRIEVEALENRLLDLWHQANETDDRFQEQFSFAFHPTYGFLTACPAEAGTAMRASAMLHLPAAVAMGTFSGMVNGLTRLNVAVREVFGDPGGGDFFRITNLSTLGMTEANLIDQVRQAIVLAVETEQQARSKWRAVDLTGLKREIQKAMAELRTLDLSSKEDQVRWRMVRALSRMRLGLQLGILSPVERAIMAARFQLIWLQPLLDLAITNEDYRAASRIRDRIKILGDAE